MADTTAISWADATFNPWMGCEKVSPGCAHCYAETLTTGRMGLDVWGDSPRKRTSESNWRKPHAWQRAAAKDGKRLRVFCASLADVFEPRPELDPWRRDLFDLIAATPDLDWLLLTKRPEEARDWLRAWYEGDQAVWADTLLGSREWTSRDHISWGVLPNVWIGTSIENSRFTWRADALREIPATVRFLSCEPLVGSLYPRPLASNPDSRSAGSADDAAEGGPPTRERSPLDLTGIDWVIVGGESGGKNARPMHPQWAREIRDAVLWNGQTPCPEPWTCGCEETPRELRPALHMKQWGSWTPDPDGRDPDGVWVSLDGRSRSSLTADAFDDLPNGSMRMRYAGAQPHSGGKYLDGVDWCEIPDPRVAVA
jgi:protein gp37